MKHNYKGKPCMACGGAVCNKTYMDLRKQVEGEKMAPLSGQVAGIDSSDEIMKGMKQPLGYSKGGSVAADEDHENLKGIHKSNHVGRGNSMVGSFTKAIANKSTSLSDEELKSASKEHHKKVLGEMKSMKKPHGMFAEGGPVPSPSSQPSGMNQGTHDYNSVGPNEQKARNVLAGVFGGGSEAQAGEKKAHGGMMAEGGEMDGDADDDMLMDQCAHECMEAVKKGDKKMFKDSIKALIAECMSKMGGE